MADTYAIVESGGKQYRAEKGGMLLVDRLPADEGSKVSLRAVMFRGGDRVVVEGGQLEKVKVEATVAGHERGKKIRVFKYRPKKGYRRRAGHRSELTRLEVTEVRLLSRKPAAKKADADEKPKRGTAREPAQRKPAVKAGTARKPAAKKPAAKAGTARKPAAKKPAAGKARGGRGSATRKASSSRTKKEGS